MAPKKQPLTLYQRIKKIRQAGLGQDRSLVTATTNLAMLPVRERLAFVDELLRHYRQQKVDAMYVFIMYDIENNKIRGQIAKYLLKNGCTRVQKSVFLASVKRKKYQELHTTLRQINSMYDNQDSIFFVPVGESILNNMKIVGKNIDFELITNPGTTLFI